MLFQRGQILTNGSLSYYKHAQKERAVFTSGIGKPSGSQLSFRLSNVDFCLGVISENIFTSAALKSMCLMCLFLSLR